MSAQTDLVVDHLPLVAQEARRITRREDAREELEGWGALGLLEAARRWDPNKGVPFGAYARIRIRGTMLDAARRWFPGPRDRPIRQVSLDMVNIVDPVGVDTRMLQDEEYGEVVSAVMQLPAREREVILRAYWEGDTFTKIAEDTGLSVSWISRQHQKALERLRKEIG